MGGNTQGVSSCPWYIFMDLWLGRRVCFGRTVLCVMGSLTFVFCCTVLDVVLQNGGKHTGCEFFSMVYFYGAVVGGRVCFGRTVLCVMGSLTFVFCCTVVDVVFAQWGETHRK